MMVRIRAFFAAREVLEVETPLLSRHATTDLHIESFTTGERWLHTSPEFAMKRLLAAGSGDVWQACRVFRREEAGRFHNPEFTLLEWYRVGFDHHALMTEVESLLLHLELLAPSQRCRRLSYRDAFHENLGLDPLMASIAELREACTRHGITLLQNLSSQESDDRDFWLDLLMSHRVAPGLGLDAPCFLFDFPASQAALARVHGETAARFELVWRGVELANGFHELTDAAEQARRFRSDRERRQARGLTAPPCDVELVAALAHGLPDCAGVALGLDRLLMLALGAERIGEVLAFDWSRA